MTRNQRSPVKRRASSSAASDTSESWTAKCFNALERAKKIKRERVEPEVQLGFVPSSTTSAPTRNAPSDVNGDTQACDTARAATEDGITPSVTSRSCVTLSHNRLVVPSDLHVYIFTSERAITTKLCQYAIDDLVTQAFASGPTSDAMPPAMDGIVQMVERLGAAEVPEKTIKRVEGQLQKEWRRRMARYLGPYITTEDQLKDAVAALGSTLAFVREHNGVRVEDDEMLGLASRDCTADVEAQLLHDSSDDNDDEAAIPEVKEQPSAGPEKVDAIDHEAKGGPNTPSRHLETDLKTRKRCLATARKQSAHPSDDGDDAYRPEQKPNGACASSIVTPGLGFKEVRRTKAGVPEYFETFLHHVGQYGHAVSTPEQVDALRKRAMSVCGSFKPKEHRKWERLHNRSSKGDIDRTCDERASKIMSKQNIASRFASTTTEQTPVRIPSIQAKSKLRAMFIPFMSKQFCQTSRMLLFVLNTPDAPSLPISKEELHEACADAFGAGAYVSLEKRTDYVWVAEFTHRRDAEANRGATILVKGARLVAEYLPSKAPYTFVCDVTTVKISMDAIALEVSKAFAGRDETPKLHEQEAFKLYAGRYFTLSFKASPKLFRFYLPVNVQDSSEQVMICFKALAPSAKCPLCRSNHDLTGCQNSHAVALPPVS